MFTISVQDVSKTFAQGGESRLILNQITLSLPAGASLGIMGKSGGGKSTFIRLLNGLEKPDKGRVEVGGQDVNALSPQALRALRQKIGMIFQHYPLVLTRTVYDNIALPLVLAGQNPENIQKTVFELLELVGLADKPYRFPQQLSGGQQQRVAIARALAAEPELILADEMTSALDPETTEDILNLFQSIQKKRCFTLIVVAHDPHVVRTLCSQTALLEDGCLNVQAPAIGDTLRPPIALADYLDSKKGGH